MTLFSRPVLWGGAFLFVVCLRLYALWASPYLADNYYHLRDLRTLAPATPLGPVMTGPPARVPGGAYYALLRLAGPSPVGVEAAKALAAAIGFLVLLALTAAAWSVGGGRTAWWMFLLAGTNPTLVVASADFWNANFALLPAALATWFLLRPKRGRFGDFLVLPLVALAAQIHFSALLVLAPAVAFFLLRRLRERSLPSLLAGLVGAALLYVPYLVSEIGSGFANTHAMLHAKGALAKWVPPRADALLIFPSAEIGNFIGSGRSALQGFYERITPLPAFGLTLWVAGILSLVAVALLWILLAARLVPSFRKAQEKRGVVASPAEIDAQILFGVGLLGAFAVFTVLRVRGDGFHYFYPLLPAALLAFVGGAASFLRAGKAWAIATRALLLSLAVLGAFQTIAIFHRHWQPLRWSNQVEFLREVDLRAPEGFRLLTPYENANRSVYQEWGIPGFFEGTAKEMLGLRWAEKPDAKRIFLVDAPDPSFHWKKGFPSDRKWVEIWRKDRLVLYEGLEKPSP